jgi:putative ABC transport system permease protein
MAAMLQTLRNDVRYALRLLRRSPGFAGATILTLALSIGADAAIFSAVQGVLISPLPYPEPDRLVRLFEEAPTTPHFPMAPADFRDYRAELQTFEGLAAYLRSDLQLGDAARPEHLRGMQVTAGFFRLLGYQPLFGREFELDDELPGRNEVVILSHGLWMRRFDGDGSVIGRSVRLSGRTFRVVGVLPADFQHVGGTYRTYGHGETIDIWSVLPVPREERSGLRFAHYFNVVGRIRPGVSRGEMAQDLKRTGVSVARRYPNPNSPWSPSAVPLKQEIVGTAESTLLVLSGAAAAVLLLACVNVAGLLLGRASSRSREIGVRAALGATRWRLARQMLVESVVLAAAGGVIGIALAYGAIAALTRFGPSDLPRLQAIAIDGTVLGSTVAVIVLCALAFGFAPAWRLARAGVGDALRDGGRSVAGESHQRTRRLLVAAEVALAFVLVVSSGLLLRSFIRMMNADPGFEPGRAVTVSVDLPTARYDTPASTAFYQRAADRVRALPGVAEAAFSSDLPWTGYDENTSFSIVGQQFPPGDGPEARYHFITHGYTRATGTPVVAGRDFTTGDGPGAPLVVLVNESAARKYWKSADAAVGARMNVWGSERAVAGVIGDVRDMPWHDRAVPALSFPQPQRWYPQPMFLIARTQIDPSSTVESIRGAFREIDAELPLASVRLLDSVASAAIATRRLTLWLVAIFGFTAVVLAVVGVYGVIAQAVAQRTHEFGIRQALGATRGDILRLVMVSGAAMTIVGLTGGLALAAASTRLLGSLLYGVAPFDPVTFATVAGILAVASGGAVYLPAHRATRISASVALRDA